MNFGGDFQQMEDFILEMLGRETNGKTLGIYYKDDQTGETTVNLGVVQYSPEGMELSLDIRYPKNGSAKEVEEQVRKAAQKYQLEVLECETTPMLYMPIESELIQKLMHVYHEITGRKAASGDWRRYVCQSISKYGGIWTGVSRRSGDGSPAE